MTITTILNLLSAIFAFTAAGLWLRASRAIVTSTEPGAKMGNGEFETAGIKLVATSRLQGRLNAQAAISAALAAALQGLASLAA